MPYFPGGAGEFLYSVLLVYGAMGADEVLHMLLEYALVDDSMVIFQEVHDSNAPEGFIPAFRYVAVCEIRLPGYVEGEVLNDLGEARVAIGVFSVPFDRLLLRRWEHRAVVVREEWLKC